MRISGGGASEASPPYLDPAGAHLFLPEVMMTTKPFAHFQSIENAQGRVRPKLLFRPA